MTNYSANGDECPAGDECGIHFRVDEELFDDEYEGGRMISYVGDWCVVTDDNGDPMAQLKLAANELGLPVKDALPDRYETMVHRVGKGALDDLYQEDLEAIKDATRYVVTHDSWSNFKEAHAMVVTAVAQDLINLDNPAF